MVPLVGVPQTILQRRERAIVGKQHQDGGRASISLDWTLSHHEDGFEIDGVKRSYDDVHHGMSRFQTVVTAMIASLVRIDGIAVEVQRPDFSEAERGHLKMTAQLSYEEMEPVRQRLVALLQHQKHQLAYRKRTEIVVDVVRQIETERQFPKAAYAFDNGVLTLELTQLIEASGKHWVSEIESSRLKLWHGQWQRS
ncbi:MAG: hypothetical protein ACAF41_27045 [Leptolyngbya sp. BL-A-14]